MKEITRRLYTKPVMLGMAFLMGMALRGWLVRHDEEQGGAEPVSNPGRKRRIRDPRQRRNFPRLRGLSDTRGLLRARFPAHSTGSWHSKACLCRAGSNVDTIIQRHQTVYSAGRQHGAHDDWAFSKEHQPDHRHL